MGTSNAIDLMSIQPHQVSKDLRGYSVLLYGAPKTGKTTTATKFPNHLLLAFEKGFSAIPGAMAQPINTWAEFKKVLKQLKEDDVKAKFSTIIIDTVDLCFDACETYICANAKRADGGFGIDSIGDLPFGSGYTLEAKEFDNALRSIVQMDYGLVMISHATDKTFKDETGQEYNQIVPTLGTRPRNIVSRMCDIIGYAAPIMDEEGNTTTKFYMRGTPRYMAGSRFKYTPSVIDFSYENLTKAIAKAIEKQEKEEGKEYFTKERENLYKDIGTPLDFDELMSTFNNLINQIATSTEEKKFKEYWQPRITQIVDKYLGKGQKVNNCSREQVEALDLIITDLKELIEAQS